MKVFRACLTIIRRRSVAMLVYFVIFIALCVVMTAFSVDQFTTDFVDFKPNYTIINRDGDSAFFRGLSAYLEQRGTPVPLEDSKEALQDAAFYHASDYILIIPAGFSASLSTEAPLELETVTTPDSARGYYTDSLVNQFCGTFQAYRQLRPEMAEEQRVEAVLRNLEVETQVEKKQFGVTKPLDDNYHIYNRMSCYILMVLVTLSVSTILMVFRRQDLRLRNLCSPLKPRSMNGQLLLCGGLMAAAAWALLTLVGLVIYGSRIAETDGRILLLLMLNSLVFTLVALSVSMLASTFIRSSNSQNAVANFLSLALCFLGGVFVPLEMLGDAMLNVSRFTPTYWYITALDRIAGLTSFGWDALSPIWLACLIELGFAVAITCVALAINKVRSQPENSPAFSRTEVEA